MEIVHEMTYHAMLRPPMPIGDGGFKKEICSPSLLVAKVVGSECLFEEPAAPSLRTARTRVRRAR